MKTLTINKAYELAVQKWEYIVKNGGEYGDLIKDIPILDTFTAECSYCELFKAYGNNPDRCKGCPLNIDNKELLQGMFACNDPEHPYQQWDRNPTKETAQAVLDLIVKTKP